MSGLGIERIPTDERAVAQDSVLGEIRALYEQAKGPKHLDLPLPQNDVLAVRYRAVDPEDMPDVDSVAREALLDLLIAACECMLVKRDGRWEPWIHDGEPVRFDPTLSELAALGVPPIEQGGTARDVVLQVFRTAPSPITAAVNHAIKVDRWMAGEPVDEERLLGES